MKNVAILLSGGVGSRISSDVPKQYVRIGGYMMISYSLFSLIRNPQIDGIYIVAHETWRDGIVQDIKNVIADSGKAENTDWNHKIIGFADPGENRQCSILNAMEQIKAYVKKYVQDSKEVTVLIHDAARPCLTDDMINRCYAALGEHDGVMPVIPMKDTIYMSDDGHTISGLMNRSKVYAGQAPELFRFDPYYQATLSLLPGKIMRINGTTEPAIMAGLDIVMINGDEGNLKVTTDADMDKIKEVLSLSETV